MKNMTKQLLFGFGICLSTISIAQEHDYKTFEKNTMDGTKVGVSNKKTGKEVLPAIYDGFLDYSQGRFFMKNNGKVGVIDTIGKIIIPITYDEIGYMEDRAFAKKGGKWAMFNYQNGIAMTGFVYDDIYGYQDGVARVVQNDKIGYLDKFGKTILGCKFTEGYDCWGDFILVYEKSFISTGYEYVTKNKQGEVTNKQDIGYGGKKPIVFNKKGQIVYEGKQYEKVKYHDGKSVFVVTDGSGSEKLLGLKGETIFPYNQGYGFKSTVPNWIMITSAQGVGIVALDGKILLKPNFKKISDYEFRNKELAKVFFQDGTFFYIDKMGSCVEFEVVKCPE
jgi:hypothetical protein